MGKLEIEGDLITIVAWIFLLIYSEGINDIELFLLNYDKYAEFSSVISTEGSSSSMRSKGHLISFLYLSVGREIADKVLHRSSTVDARVNIDSLILWSVKEF